MKSYRQKSTWYRNIWSELYYLSY